MIRIKETQYLHHLFLLKSGQGSRERAKKGKVVVESKLYLFAHQQRDLAIFSSAPHESFIKFPKNFNKSINSIQLYKNGLHQGESAYLYRSIQTQ